jgi:diadenosine tetraphosphatase ApaH/serine/threonine PP2A family protein phosphatase
LRGNHERYVAHYDTPHASPIWKTQQFAPLHWALEQLDEPQRQEMSTLPLTLRLAEAPHLLLCHASSRSDYDTILSHTPESQLDEMFPNSPERFIVRGHNHVGQVRLWRDQFIVTNGSVGLALDGNATAQYLLLDQTPGGWRIQHQSVPYDVDAVVARFRATGYLAATGPIGRLFLREVVTATQHLVPFMRLYARWTEEASLSLDAAVERFLNSY